VLRVTIHSCAAETIALLATEHRNQDAAATDPHAHASDPTGYGRVIRDKDDRVRGIVEHARRRHRGARVDEINTSIYCFRRNLLAPALRRLSPENAQGEYYLNRRRSRSCARRHKVIAVTAEDPRRHSRERPDAARRCGGRCLRGRINRPLDARRRDDGRPVAHLHRRDGRARTRRAAFARHHSRKAARPSRPGQWSDPTCTWSTCGGRARRSSGTAWLTAPRSATTVRWDRFAYLRPGTRLAAGARAGTFVGLKNADNRARAPKVAALSYVGDADVGADVNLGASTIHRQLRRASTSTGPHRDGVHTKHPHLAGRAGRAPATDGDGAGAVVTHDVSAGPARQGCPRARLPRRRTEVARGWGQRHRHDGD